MLTNGLYFLKEVNILRLKTNYLHMHSIYLIVIHSQKGSIIIIESLIC